MAPCTCHSRRDFLAKAGGGFGALALHALLQQEASAAEKRSSALEIDPVNPLLPRDGHFSGKARSVIFLYMVGGPSQVDTFDPKPLLQKLDGQPVPQSFRDAAAASRFSNLFVGSKDLMASPWKFSQHGQSGSWVSELFPNVARHVDDLCFIHSMQAENNNHAPASYHIHTGETTVGKPSLGSWITYGLGTENQNLPGYVLLFEAGPYGGAGNYSNGFLPAAFQGTRLRSEGTPVLDLIPPSTFASGQRASLDLIHQFNMKHRATRPGVTELDARISSYELAYRMQMEATDAFDIEKEPESIRKMYGDGAFARQTLIARRLLERGVRFIQLWTGDGQPWDNHDEILDHKRLGQQVDQPIAAFIRDLKMRGMFDDTLIIWGGEFGRTPAVELPSPGNNIGKQHGRDHNHWGFTYWLAGGGTKGGYTHGATDEFGFQATENPVHVHDLHATILRLLGFDHERFTYKYAGLDFRLTGVNECGVVKELRA